MLHAGATSLFANAKEKQRESKRVNEKRFREKLNVEAMHSRAFFAVSLH